MNPKVSTEVALLKLATWNINGLHSATRKGLDGWIAESSNDVICLQEVKAQEDLFAEHRFDGYTTYWSTATKPGYSGVATLVSHRLHPIGIHKGIGAPQIDDEGRVLTIEFETFDVINVYAPHSHRELRRLDFKLTFLKYFFDFVEARRASGKRIVIVGDLNIAHREIDLSNPGPNKKNAGFRPEERRYMDVFIESGFVDAFRLRCNEPGHYTWWSPIKGVRERNIGWRIDYVLVDNQLKGYVRDCFHSPEVTLSDHCPVTAVIEVPGQSMAARRERSIQGERMVLPFRM